MTHMRNELRRMYHGGKELKRMYHQKQETWSGLATYEKSNSILEYTWRRYNLNTTTTYVESYLGTASNVSQTSPQGNDSYSLNSNTGIFTATGFFYPRLGDTRYIANGNTLRKETAISDNGYGTITFSVQRYTSVQKTNNSRGSYIGTVKSANSTAYSTNGVTGSYWYDTRTSAYIKGNLIGNVEAEEGTYPTNGRHTDGFWYILQS